MKFSIDQLNGKIFNRDSLPYLFDVDSVTMTLTGKIAGSFSKVVINLKDNDSTFTMSTDSLPFKRLKSIETTALDEKSMLKYDISINIHQQDPYIFTWNLMTENHLNWVFDEQRTVSHNGTFYTLYEKDGVVRAAESATNDAEQWTPVVVSGLPSNVILSSLIAIADGDAPAIYMLSSDGVVWCSDNGQLWSKKELDYPVRAIYGIMPMIEHDNQILLMAEVEGELKFASTTDFEQMKLWNKPEENVPLVGFDVIRIENESVYGANYIVMYGGLDYTGQDLTQVWILQEKGGEINAIGKRPDIDFDEAELFYYDNRVYLLAFVGEDNLFYTSRNYGVDWLPAGDNQVLPEEFRNRKSTTVITDENNFIWIFGGKSDKDDHIVDVWRGRLNKLAGE